MNNPGTVAPQLRAGGPFAEVHPFSAVRVAKLTLEDLVSPESTSHAAWDAHALHGVHAMHSVGKLGTAA